MKLAEATYLMILGGDVCGTRYVRAGRPVRPPRRRWSRNDTAGHVMAGRDQ